jgi:hypothetical protein
VSAANSKRSNRSKHSKRSEQSKCSCCCCSKNREKIHVYFVICKLVKERTKTRRAYMRHIAVDVPLARKRKQSKETEEFSFKPTKR